MASDLESGSPAVRAWLADAGSEDRQRFFEERRRLLEDGRAESPLLDQLCHLRVVTARLAEGYAAALSVFEAALEQRTRMRPGWRKSRGRKAVSEYESPVPWLHPFRLAREELAPLQGELETAAAAGETRERQPERLREVLAKHELALPLPSPLMPPKYLPGGLRAGDHRLP
jgi:hypothetical protein